MILGKVTVEVEFFQYKYIFCRPLINGKGVSHPRIIGIPHVVQVEKNSLTSHLEIGDVFETYAIFDRFHGDISWDAGYTRVKIQPITRRIFEDLSLLYPQKEHTFKCG